MNNSVKRFVRKHSEASYSPTEFECLANDLSTYSGDRYTQKSALKVLARYARADGDVIRIDPDDRKHDRVYENILKELDGESSESDSCDNYDETDDSESSEESSDDNASDGNGDDEVSADESSDEDSVDNENNAESDVEGEESDDDSSGDARAAEESANESNSDSDGTNYDESEESDEVEEPEPVKPTKKAKASVKAKAKATAKAVPKKAQAKTKAVPKKAQSPTKQKSKDVKTAKTAKTAKAAKPTKILGKIDPTISPEDVDTVHIPARTMNLFTGRAMTNTKPKAPVKAAKVVRCASDEEPEYSSDTSSNDSDFYSIPDEKEYAGLYRTDEKYGPYGTDNYHDKNPKSDKLNKVEKRRLDVYNYLDSIQYYPQRSAGWFNLRDKLISASDGGTVVGLNPYEKQFDFIAKKVHGRPFETSIDCYHGKKFEEIATMAYEYRMNVHVKEFGLCQHTKHKILGASPDGIVCPYKLKLDINKKECWRDIDEKIEKIKDRVTNDFGVDIESMNDKEKHAFFKQVQEVFTPKKEKILDNIGRRTKNVGRMLEIKCPMRRKILMDPDAPEVYGAHGEPIKNLKLDVKKGVCPAYYWVQVQLQLECCDLDECDFWQCEIAEYEDFDDFLDDTDPEYPWLAKSSKQEKGALVQIMPIDKLQDTSMDYNNRIYNYADFIYMPRVTMTPKEVEEWLFETIKNINWTHQGYVFESVKYFRITESRNITIPRDRKWFADNLPEFERIWSYVEFLRADKQMSKLLKLYMKTFKTDWYGKIRENKPNEIMEVIEYMCNKPDNDAPDKEHRKYARFVARLEEKIREAGVEDDAPDVDVEEEIEMIKEALEFDSDDSEYDDMEGDDKLEIKIKHADFVRGVKKLVDDYLLPSE